MKAQAGKPAPAPARSTASLSRRPNLAQRAGLTLARRATAANGMSSLPATRRGVCPQLRGTLPSTSEQAPAEGALTCLLTSSRIDVRPHWYRPQFFFCPRGPPPFLFFFF